MILCGTNLYFCLFLQNYGKERDKKDFDLFFGHVLFIIYNSMS